METTVPVAQRFGRFEIRPAQRQLLIDGAPATLGARAFDLLLTLAERRERVVSKAELLDLVWPRVIVEENNLQVQVSALRRLLGPQAIATVPGRGYRFTAPACDDANLQVAPPAAAAAPAPAMPAASPAAAANNLPPADRALFGRDTDLAELALALPRQRLLTVVGAGGIGKTRLALAAAHAAVESGFFSGGAAWIELAPLADAGLLVPTIARAVAVPLEAADPAERQAQLAERLAGRCAGGPLLLVLDNCEHLVAAVAALAQALLGAAPSLHLLATSQEPLRLAAERVWRLGPLAVDSGEVVAAADAATVGDAVRLFAERVRSLQPAFQLDASARADATEICRQLDGIPLAIELAAARVPLLGVAGLRERLEKAAGDAARPDARLRVLGSGRRGAPQRQQTLAAALEWSHALLNANEQRVLRRLGVFAGGFGLGLLPAVVGEPGDDEWALLETLGTLADKSLVSVDPGSVPRYRLLESTRAFALDRLSSAGEALVIRDRHAGAMETLLDELDARRWTERTDRLEAQLAPELDNLRAALAWAAQASDDPQRRRALVALAGGSTWLWKRIGFVPEGLRWCQLALDRIDPGTPPAVEARLLQGWATLAHQQDAEAELAALTRAAMLWAAAGDRLRRFTALVATAKKLVWRYDHEATAAALREAEAVFDPAFPPPAQAQWLLARTFFLEATGRPAEGQPLVEQNVALLRAWGDPNELDSGLCDLAENLFVQGKAAEAVPLLQEIATRRRGRPDAGQNLANLAAALIRLGRTDEALRVAREAVPLERASGRVDAMLDHWALLACQRGRLEAAALALGTADAGFEATGFAREQGEQQASDAARAWLGRELPQDRLERLLAEGRTIGADAALEGVLGD
jgi:predicted ATPase/DNA-binding winged helix-turn-helix (wHTH) protein